MSGTFAVEVSLGEAIDKITILEIKSERIHAAAQLNNVRNELRVLRPVVAKAVADLPELRSLAAELKAVNELLWDIENDIRECERNKDFGDRFIVLARSVYRTNDRRAKLKNEISRLAGSSIVEEKSYTAY